MVATSGLPTSGRIPPSASADTLFFWEAAARHRLVAQRCTRCGALRHPPGPMCPKCRSLEWESMELSGGGTLYSYAVQHYPLAPGFNAPYVIGIVDLDEGVRMVANVDADLHELVIGARVVVCFLDQTEGWTAPQFVLAR